MASNMADSCPEKISQSQVKIFRSLNYFQTKVSNLITVQTGKNDTEQIIITYFNQLIHHSQ